MSQSASPPAAGAARGRPWYLVAALVVAWLLGAFSFVEGGQRASAYRSGDFDEAGRALTESTGGDDPEVKAAAERYVAAINRSRGRGFPLAVASLILGAAMTVFAARALARRPSARSQLLQVTGASAGLLVIGYVLTADLRRASVDLTTAVFDVSMQKGAASPAQAAFWRRVLPRVPLVVASVEGATFGLIALALTRRRARAFFEG